MSTKRLLRVEATDFVAGATWERGAGGWQCVADGTEPFLQWMVGKPAKDVAEWIRKKGYRHSWQDCPVAPESTHAYHVRVAMPDGGETKEMTMIAPGCDLTEVIRTAHLQFGEERVVSVQPVVVHRKADVV